MEPIGPGAVRPKLSPGYSAIIAFKYAQVAAFLLFGGAVLRIANVRDREDAAEIAGLLGVDHHNALLRRLSDLLDAFTPGQERAIAAAAGVVALVFGAEATCLLLRKWWAPYFTIALTALGIPLELFEIAKRPGGARNYLLLAANLAILAYVWRRRNDFRRSATAA